MAENQAKKKTKKKRKKHSSPRLRYRRKYKQLEKEVERISAASAKLGEYIVKWLDEALEALRKDNKEKAKRLIRRILRRGQVSMIGKRKDKEGKTVFTDHLVVNSKGRVRHYGIHGVKGWNPENLDEVQFKNKQGEDMEYEEIGPHRGGRRKGKRKKRKRKRGRGWKKAG